MYIRLNGELLYECTTKFLPNSTGKPVQYSTVQYSTVQLFRKLFVFINIYVPKYKTRRSNLRDITGMTL